MVNVRCGDAFHRFPNLDMKPAYCSRKQRKRMQLLFVLVGIVLSLSSSSAAAAGAAASVSLAGLQYIKSVAVPLLEKEVSGASIPEISTDAKGFTITISSTFVFG